MSTYIDSGIVMRIVEGDADRHALLRKRADEAGAKVTSVITRTECLIIAIRRSDAVAIDDYEKAFASTDLDVVDVDAAVADEAAIIRASFNLKVPDAIHVATALVHHCNRILTTDSDLVRCNSYRGLAVEVLPRVSVL